MGQPIEEGLLDKHKSGLLSGRKATEEENQRLRAALEAIGVAERDRLRREIDEATAQLTATRIELTETQTQVVETRETAILQEVGIYSYRHPLDDAVAYKGQLKSLSDQIKTMARTGSAVVGSTDWSVNGSKPAGQRMVKDFCKLMLRAYNNEADNAVRTLKPHTLASSVARLTKSRETIVRLGKTMNIRVTDQYHHLRVAELELTADYLAKVAEEKEREREERARLREEEIARREIEREQAKLDKERQHYQTALEAMRANGDVAGIAEAEAKLADIDSALAGLAERAANTRVGHVYVISNVGSFGPGVVKIGMTRRLDPMDRVHELGNASVPFRYDVHAMIFSKDAVGLERNLHHIFAERRINWVNNRREFFRVTPAEVRQVLEQDQGSVLSYVDEPEALEWRQSENARRQLVEGQAPPEFAP